MSDDPQDRPTRQAGRASDPAERATQEQQVQVLAAGASRTTWEILACVYMARQARTDALLEEEGSAAQQDFIARTVQWGERAWLLLEKLADQAPSIYSRLERLGFDLDQADAPADVGGEVEGEGG